MLSVKEYVIGRRIERTSDRGKVLGGNTVSVRRSRQDCRSTLYILPQDQNNYMCLECGQKYSIAEQQQQKGKVGTLDDNNSNSICVVHHKTIRAVD
jgi:hypothetical protein